MSMDEFVIIVGSHGFQRHFHLLMDGHETEGSLGRIVMKSACIECQECHWRWLKDDGATASWHP
jgi:hypothetical protein